MYTVCLVLVVVWHTSCTHVTLHMHNACTIQHMYMYVATCTYTLTTLASNSTQFTDFLGDNSKVKISVLMVRITRNPFLGLRSTWLYSSITTTTLIVYKPMTNSVNNILQNISKQCTRMWDGHAKKHSNKDPQVHNPSQHSAERKVKYNPYILFTRQLQHLTHVVITQYKLDKSDVQV